MGRREYQISARDTTGQHNTSQFMDYWRKRFSIQVHAASAVTPGSSRTANINWTRLNQTGLSGVHMVGVINSSFFIDYCSGRCDRHRSQHNLKYALQMSKLVRGCQDNQVDCMELMPCCVPMTYHGKSNPTRIEFKTKTILVTYVNELSYVEEYYHTFLEPRVCHCQ